MIYYPLSILMLMDIKEILIISSNDDLNLYKNLFGDGSDFGLSIQYAIQCEPRGLAEAFIIGEDFIKNDSVCLILGDNLFFGNGLGDILKKCKNTLDGAHVFGVEVKDPHNFGVAELIDNKVISLEEKPKNPKSNIAVTGLYLYNNDVIKYAKEIKPSNRGELEITSINNIYLDKGNLNIQKLHRGITWLDTGTHKSLLKASQFVEIVEKNQKIKIGCIEEIAFVNGWINKEVLNKHIKINGKSSYSNYLKDLI